MSSYDDWAENEDAVFIVGPARSGTSVMFRTLYESPGFWSLKDGSETTAFVPGRLQLRPLAAPTSSFLGKRHHTFIAAAESCKDSPRALARLYFHEASQWYGSGRLVEKTPRHVYHIPAIIEAFPRARIVFMSRNPRDIIISHRARYERDKALGVAESQILWLRSPVDQLLESFHRIDAAISSALSSWPDKIVRVSYDRMMEGSTTELKTIGEQLVMPSEDIEAMIRLATRERVAAPDKTNFPLRDAPLGRTAQPESMLTPAEEKTIAAVSFVHL